MRQCSYSEKNASAASLGLVPDLLLPQLDTDPIALLRVRGFLGWLMSTLRPGAAEYGTMRIGSVNCVLAYAGWVGNASACLKLVILLLLPREASCNFGTCRLLSNIVHHPV